MTIKTAHQLSNDFTLSQLRNKGYQAIILAVGAQASVPLNVPGEQSAGCYTAIEILDKIQRGENLKIGKRVVVIGGGFCAVDVARAGLRMGAEEVYIAYRRTEAEMPAVAEEMKAAEEEGVKFMYLVSPKEIVADANGNVSSISLVNCVLDEVDASDRRRSIPVEGTEFSLKADTIITALGQRTEDFNDPELLKLGRDGLVMVDAETFKTNLPDVYAVGDAALGASDIISAIASGKRAAVAVDNKIAGDSALLGAITDLHPVDPDFVLERKGNTKRVPAIDRLAIPVPERTGNSEVCTTTYRYEDALAEAKRCLNCGCGDGCMLCVELCNSFAISNVDGKPHIVEEDCVGCGVCVWRCPTENLAMIPAGN